MNKRNYYANPTTTATQSPTGHKGNIHNTNNNSNSAVNWLWNSRKCRRRRCQRQILRSNSSTAVLHEATAAVDLGSSSRLPLPPALHLPSPLQPSIAHLPFLFLLPLSLSLFCRHLAHVSHGSLPPLPLSLSLSPCRRFCLLVNVKVFIYCAYPWTLKPRIEFDVSFVTLRY